jgi:hypothetical protein
MEESNGTGKIMFETVDYCVDCYADSDVTVFIECFLFLRHCVLLAAP